MKDVFYSDAGFYNGQEMPEGWYYLTTEGDLVGPFDSREEASASLGSN